MKRVVVTINPKQWGHLTTKYPANSPMVEVSDFTLGTKNIDTDLKGIITKRRGGTTYSTLANIPKDQYEVIFADGSRHLLTVGGGILRYTTGDQLQHTVTSGYSAGANFEFATMQDRVYFGNGVGSPQTYDKTTSYGGVSYSGSVPKTKNMGALVPGSAPSVAVAAGGSVPLGGHTYKVTFLYYDFEESNGGTASSVATATGGNQTVNLTNIPVGGYGVTARKIYRDNNDGNWVLLTTIANNTATTYSDTTASPGTPTPIPTDNGLPPTFGLIVSWLDALWVAQVTGEPYTLFYSEAGSPDIFPSSFNLICNEQDPITGLVVYQGRLMVFNRKSFGQITGLTPDQFRYDSIENSIGCVDNRSIQVRVVDGVPVLVWLSDRGFYAYDGNAVQYISDPIEDQVNVSVQQAVQQKGSNSQNTQAEFQAGTPSNGIDLTSIPGEVTTKNPHRVWDDQTDWEGGSYLGNVVTRDGSNQIKSPTKFEPSAASGTFSGTILSGGLIKLPQSTAFNGETSSIGSSVEYTYPNSSLGKFYAVAVPIIPTRSGTLTAVKFSVGRIGGAATDSFIVTVESDSGGTPSGTVLASGTLGSNGNSPLHTSTSMSVSLTAGVRYWMVIKVGSSSIAPGRILTGSALSGGGTLVKDQNGSNGPSGSYYGAPFTAAAGYTFNYTHNSASGTWTSTIWDTQCVNFDTSTAYVISILSASFPFSPGSDISIAVHGSNDPTMSSFTVVSMDGAQTTSNNHNFQNFRYWRVRLTFSVNDDVFTPSTSGPRLQFTANSSIAPQVWISEVVDCTSDVTVFNSLNVVSTAPAGTSVTVEIATSTDNVTYTSYVAFGSVVVHRYAKIRVTLVMNAAQDTTPSVTSIDFKWTIVANLKSSIIDTTTTPAGWDVFLASFIDNGGTVQFQMRSASSSGGISSATFYDVTAGNFPDVNILPNRYVQWKVIITSTADEVPEITNVTVSWFISIAGSIRVASIFVNGRYYLAAAQFGHTTNNLLFVLDLKGKWRMYGDVNVGTFSFFFNAPYYTDAATGNVVKFLEGSQDQGTNIPADIRLKALDFSGQYDSSEYLKQIDYVVLQGVGTGAAYKMSYSLDEGNTFTYLKYEGDATVTYTSANDSKAFVVRFKADKSDGKNITGRTVLIRIESNDANDIAVQSVKVFAWMLNVEPFVLP